jgi:dihydroorotate dehydrogenase
MIFATTVDSPERSQLLAMNAPLYDIRLSYDSNSDGPAQTPPPASDEVVAADLNRTLLGLRVGYPIGVPASPLTANSRWIETCSAQGFNVLTYKTVRSKSTPSLPAPNWLFTKDLAEPLPINADIDNQPVRVHRFLRRPNNPRAYSMINSCGIPSDSPVDWEADIRRSLEVLRRGQILLVSVVGDYENLSGDQLVDDFVEIALRVEQTGASIVELNLSCPNSVSHESGGLLPPICKSMPDTRRIVKAVRNALSPQTKLVVKLSYLTRNELENVVGSIADSIDGISGINTLQVPVADDERGPIFVGTPDNPSEPRRRAGLSGVAIRDYALDFVRSLALLRRKFGWEFEIVAMGGVMEPHDVRALMASGADAVQSATAAENNPELPREICGDGHRLPSEEERLTNLVAFALDDDRWAFRTVGGLASELGLSLEDIERVLEARPQIARRSVMTDQAGHPLYSSFERKPTMRERLEQLRWMLAR